MVDVRRDGHRRKKGTSSMSDEEWREFTSEVKAVHQERFRILNERRTEMGMSLENEDDSLADMDTFL